MLGKINTKVSKTAFYLFKFQIIILSAVETSKKLDIINQCHNQAFIL